MGGVALGTSGLGGYDRYAAWGRWAARAALAVLAVLLIASALVPLTVGRGEEAKPPAIVVGKAAVKDRPRDADLQLYDRAIARIVAGENYYDFIAAEHRRADYPLRPGVAVRLPTLAYLDALMGVNGDAPAPLAMAAAVALMLGVIAAWWQRLEGVDPSMRRIGTALVFFGASLGLNRYYFVLHELWAGMLLALALGLHRPERGKYGGAVLAAGLALAIREHALPFVLLMGAMAAWRRDWREAGAWGALVVLFGLGLAWHLHMVAAHTLPSDPVGPSWLALRGLSGFLSNVVLSSNLRFIPHQLAGPLTILMIFGWSGWRSTAGLTGTLLFLGYGVAFAIAGRNDNFYWGAMITPAMALGLAFVPMAFGSLWRSAFAGARPLR
jgi:hypothetical protein